MKENIRSIRALFIALLCLIPFCSCSDDNNDASIQQLSTEFLKQTVWKGDRIRYDNGVEYERNSINILFATDSRGSCEEWDVSGNDAGYYFSYTVDGNLLTIDGGDIEGWWLLMELSEDRMVLAADLEERISEKLVLDRFY